MRGAMFAVLPFHKHFESVRHELIKSAVCSFTTCDRHRSHRHGDLWGISKSVSWHIFCVSVRFIVSATTTVMLTCGV